MHLDNERNLIQGDQRLAYNQSIHPLTMSVPFAAEKQVAVAAVRRACLLTSSVFNKLVKNETVTKDDKSPVTGVFAL